MLFVELMAITHVFFKDSANLLNVRFIESVLFNQIIGGTSNLGVGVFAVLSTIGIQCRPPACPIGKHLPYTTLPPILDLGEEKEDL